ncbi:class I SAM-dependent methyltransferase [Motiliproteus coralliicola]|uniref:Class I SAM-dependent methyltransferase n=1 Tax=Motiliproteus coralliicola TaxID=2283196 RepID=A0A369W9W6_9GAMM|nr:class I SAM-dependent methyltransferase [Motiliproteus coralliicola]RDE18798.1 class I SAM-dependent methyltransferase [Motiliproteus coralliicola]
MAEDNHPQQQKWNRRYAEAGQPNQAAQVLLENRHLLPSQGTALELAAGLGGNALLLARHGLRTQAWDLSDVAMSKLQRFADAEQLPLQAHCVDLEQQPLPEAAFDLICVSAFLDRTLCASISTALKPGGLLFYQTFTQAKVRPGGPSNPDFLLKPGELLQLFSQLQPLVYREESDCGELDQGLRNQAYLIARRS